MLQHGIRPKVVKERLGHSKFNFTIDNYSNALPSLQGEAGAKLVSLLAVGGIEAR